MRSVFYKLHSWLSLPVGLILSIVCFSGAALVFQEEIECLRRPELYRVASPVGEPLLPSRLVPLVERQLPEGMRVGTIRYSGDPRRTCRIGIEGERHALFFADPYTGQVLGQSDRNGFFPFVLKLHRRLLGRFNAGSAPASPGRRIVGIATAALVAILLSGLVLWWPRRGQRIGTRLRIRWRGGRYRRWYDLHVSLGFYLVLPLLVLALTGLVWAFPTYRSGLYALFGADRGARRTASEAPARGDLAASSPVGEPLRVDYPAWDRALEEVMVQCGPYREIETGIGRVVVRPSGWGDVRRAERYEFDPATGEVLRHVPASDRSRRETIDGWIYSLHRGVWGGLFSKIVTFLAALAGGTLPLTGYYLWFRRRMRRR